MGPVLISHKDGLVWHAEQRWPLGLCAYDDKMNRWSYVWSDAADLVAGQVVEDVDSDDLLGTTPGTVTGGGAAGGDTLEDTGEFASKDVRGAIGSMIAGTIAQGNGQSFFVKKHTDDILTVGVLHGDADPRVTDDKWETALTASTTTYELILPGKVKVSTALPQIIRGVVQVDVDVSETPFGWVKQTGLGWVLLDFDNADIPVRGERILAIAGGLVKGYTAAATAVADLEGGQIIGHFPFNDPSGMDANGLILGSLTIENWAVSERYPRVVHPLN